jgi:hypothetical protein
VGQGTVGDEMTDGGFKLGGGVRGAPDDGSFRHVNDPYEPFGRIDLSGILAEEEEYVGSIGCCNTSV